MGIVKAGHEPRQHGIGVGDAAPENAAVQIDGGAVHGDFAAGDAAQSVGESGDAGGDHAGVGNGDDVAGQRFPVRLQEGGKVRTADFLFAFEQEG